MILPIIMSGSMVRAILREIEAPGTGKTMTRKLSLKPMNARNPDPGKRLCGYRPTMWRRLHDRVQAGEKAWLYVRESLAPRYFDDGSPGYRANWTAETSEFIPEPKWTPSIHMPKALSRLTLEVTGTKMERLQGISENDAVAEGIRPIQDRLKSDKVYGLYECPFPDGKIHFEDSAYRLFADLWNSLHGPGAWEANPEVVAISLAPRLANISDVKEAA